MCSISASLKIVMCDLQKWFVKTSEHRANEADSGFKLVSMPGLAVGHLKYILVKTEKISFLAIKQRKRKRKKNWCWKYWQTFKVFITWSVNQTTKTKQNARDNNACVCVEGRGRVGTLSQAKWKWNLDRTNILKQNFETILMIHRCNRQMKRNFSDERENKFCLQLKV